MGQARLLFATVLGSVLAGAAGAQEPPALRLPTGARVRLFTPEGGSVVALLAGHDDRSVTLALPPENPLAPPPEMVVPADSIRRMEVSLGKKRHALIGAALGAVLLGLTGFSDPVDTSDNCGPSSTAPCSRGEAVAAAVLGGAIVGGLVGSFVQTERWVPVALDTLAPSPPSAREIRSAPGAASAPDRVATPLQLSVRF